jgi:hypothetical protein
MSRLRRCARACFFLVTVGTGIALICESAPEAGPFQTRRIVAIGDIHGAFDQFSAILQTAGLVNNKQWSGGNTVLVQTGDVFDRGDGVRAALDLLMRLEDEARRAGGRVEALLGNHEAMNLLGEFRDVSPGTFASFADQRSADRQKRAYDDFVRTMKRKAGKGDPPPPSREEWNRTHPIGFVEYVDALGRRGKYGRWLRSHAVATTIDGTMFMHAGINPEVTTGSLDDVNNTAARDIAANDDARATLVQAQLLTDYATLSEALEAAVLEWNRIAAALKAQAPPGDHVTREFIEKLQAFLQIEKSSLLAANGPLWFRGFAQWEDAESAKVDTVIKQFGVSRFVTGHTPSSPGRIKARFNNRIFLIDTGMLTTYFKNGRPSALEFQPDGRVTAVYSDSREVLVPSAAARLLRPDLRGGAPAIAASASSR